MKPASSKRDNPFVWVKAQRKGECAECSTPIEPGDKILWDMEHHKAFCDKCGQELTE